MFFEHFEEEGHEAFEAEPTAPTTDSPFVFTWKETLARLADAPPEPDGPFGTQIELGGPALDTTALYMMRLAPRTRTPQHPTPASNIFAAARGTRTTTLDAEDLAWERGDALAEPGRPPP